MAQTRVAFVTGGSRGIGEAICRTLAQAGYPVGVAARTATDVERVAAAIREKGGQAVPVVCDVTRPASVAEALDRVKQELGPVTVLVNNAGSTEFAKFGSHDDALWHRMIDINLNSVYYVTRAALPGMMEAKWGRVINVATIGAKVGAKTGSAYAAAKGGVIALTHTLALELVQYNITVNAICPGGVESAMTDQLIASIAARTKRSLEDARTVVERINPQGRIIQPDEVAALVLMLAGDGARGINGQAINVDGGTAMY